MLFRSPGRRRWTYAEFAADVASLAASLAQRGVEPGHRVLIHLGNCPEFLISWFACAHLGAVAVTTNTRSTAAELAYFAGHSRVVGAITQPSLLDTVTGAGAEFGFLVSTDTDQGAAAERPLAPAESFDSLVAAGSTMPAIADRKSTRLNSSH